MARPSERHLSEYFDAFGPALVLYARQWVGDDASGDLVQNAFLSLMAQANPVQNVKAWLFRAVRNAALNEIRHRRVKREHSRRVAATGQAWFESGLDDLLDARAAQDALAHLDRPLREVVTLRIWGQMKLAEIAELLGEPISTIHSRYTAALSAVGKRMVSPCKTQDSKIPK